MGLLKEFKEFSVKGNLVDMAVGIIIGSAFGKVVASVVNDIIMPPIGALIGGINFSDIKIVLKESVAGAPPATLNIGSFVQTAFDFTIIALSVFIIIKAVNASKRKKEEEPGAVSAPSEEATLLAEIRDLLKKNE